MTTVTIAVPTYNRAGFLDETIESLLAQDWPDIEIVVVDDGSTDDTPRVLERLARKSANIRVLRQDNAGEASATNVAWRLGTGQLFGIVCSDDPQPPELVSRTVAFLERRPDVIVSYPDWWRLDVDGKRVGEIVVPEFSLVRLFAMGHCFVGPGAFIRRDLVIDRLPRLRDPRFRFVSDYSSWLALAALGSFARIPETIAAWRDHPEGESASPRRRQRGDEHVLLFESYFQRRDLPPEIRMLRSLALARARNLAVEIAGREDLGWWLRRRLGALVHLSPAELAQRVATRLGLHR